MLKTLREYTKRPKCNQPRPPRKGGAYTTQEDIMTTLSDYIRTSEPIALNRRTRELIAKMPRHELNKFLDALLRHTEQQDELFSGSAIEHLIRQDDDEAFENIWTEYAEAKHDDFLIEMANGREEFLSQIEEA